MQARISTVAVIVAIGLVTTVAGWVPASAQTEITFFEARAQADGFRFTFGAPGFVIVDTFVDGGGPVAQSKLDGLGNSQSFASLPYPSDNAISGPGLIAGFTGLPSLPPYPFYVNSSYPAQEQAEYSQPGINLLATSGEAVTEGSATSGGEQGDAAFGAVRAHTLARRDGGAVSAEAAVTADMISIGGTLKILSGAVTAKMSRTVGNDPHRESSFRLDGVSIAGQAVGFNEKGFVFAGSGAPIPPDNPLMESLRQGGIDVRYLAATSDENSIISPGVVITQTAELPGTPTMIFTYVFGRARAHVTVS